MDRTIVQRPWSNGCGFEDSVLVRAWPQHAEIAVSSEHGNNISYACAILEHETAMQVRDALIEAYPLDAGYAAGRATSYEEGYEAGVLETKRTLNEEYADGLRDGHAQAINEAKSKWQEVTVDAKGAGHTYRLRVPGGWLYRTTTYRFPEAHAAMERHGLDYAVAVKREAPKNYTKLLRQAQEIATQTTVFVPDGE